MPYLLKSSFIRSKKRTRNTIASYEKRLIGLQVLRVPSRVKPSPILICSSLSPDIVPYMS